MMPTLRVDDEVYSALQSQAVPFVDTPNSVLRRVLDLDEAGKPAVTKQRRARSEELLSHSAYRPELLIALAERRGSAPAREIINAVGERLRDQLKPRDLEPNNSGVIRWENRVAWQRLRLKEEGLIKSGSPEGLWELTEAGLEEAGKISAVGTQP
jgi:Mrr N-terminal domain